MGSKRFKGKVCVYCSERPAVTGDHVFAKEFFLLEDRRDLPQAPTCDACNNEKSTLEHYLTAVLPFGGRHHQARRNLVNLVPRRLAKNKPLWRQLKFRQTRSTEVIYAVPYANMALPLNGAKACDLVALIARGLAWFHWKVHLQPGHISRSIFISDFGGEFFSKVFELNAANRVQNTLGNKTVSYAGVQAKDIPQLTVWRVQLYGGLKVTGDPNAPQQVSSELAAVTGPERIVHLLTEQSQ